MEFHFVARGFRKQWAMFFESFSNAVKRPFANSLFTDLRQITLRLDSGLATTSRRRNGLTVMRIRYVTCRKDTGNTRAGCAVDRHDIAYLVGLHPRFEYIRIGFMADCQEESIDRNIHHLLIGLSLTLHQVGTLYPILSKQTDRVVLEKHGDLGIVQHPLLHHLGSTQIGLAHNQIDQLNR